MTTFGERAVGLDFNPSGDPTVAKLKGLYAEVIDVLIEAREELAVQQDGQASRLWSVAITEAQTAQMWAVKAATWKAGP